MVPAGYRSLVANLGVKDDTDDLAIVVSEVPATVAAVFTRSRFAGPSIELSRAVARRGSARGVVVISKNANVANGPVGVSDAAELRALAAAHAGLGPEDLLVASTGVIGRRYPMERIRQGFGQLAPLGPADFDRVAAAIMTTDTRPKVARARVGAATLVGVAKGVGMIEPDMATMLAFLFTDAAVDDLDGVFREVVATTFNAVSIDGDTSTSDTAAVFANGFAGPVSAPAFAEALHRVALDLTQQIAADGEGATKLIEVHVRGARDTAQARRVAKSIVNSPLVKTAVYGADPNWGRVVMAIGKCHDETDIDPDRVTVDIGEIALYPGPATTDALDAAARHMAGDRVVITAGLGIGDGSFTAYGCDLTEGYVHINADYTT